MHRIFTSLCISSGLILLALVVQLHSSGMEGKTIDILGKLIDGNPQYLLQSGSPTATQTITTTLTATATITLTTTITATFASTQTPGPEATVGITPTLDVIAPTEPTAIPISMTATLSPTATLIPFPSVTMVYPTNQATMTTTPAAVAQESDWTGVGRLFVITGLLLFWAALITWFWYVHKRT